MRNSFGVLNAVRNKGVPAKDKGETGPTGIKAMDEFVGHFIHQIIKLLLFPLCFRKLFLIFVLLHWSKELYA